jgi:YesN/AraC family two-component response regulator
MKRIGSLSEVTRRRVRILLVDDERMVLRAMRRLVLARHPDWDVLCARSGDEALRLLKDHQPVDVVVTDLNMPGVDGIVLLSIIRERFPRVARVVHSAHVEAYGRDMVRELCYQVLPKPAGAAELVGTLEYACTSVQKALIVG